MVLYRRGHALLCCCSNWSTCIESVDSSGCTFSDLYRLVYYNHLYSFYYRNDWYNISTQTLLPYLCNTKMPGMVLLYLLEEGNSQGHYKLSTGVCPSVCRVFLAVSIGCPQMARNSLDAT